MGRAAEQKSCGEGQQSRRVAVKGNNRAEQKRTCGEGQQSCGEGQKSRRVAVKGNNRAELQVEQQHTVRLN